MISTVLIILCCTLGCSDGGSSNYESSGSTCKYSGGCSRKATSGAFCSYHKKYLDDAYKEVTNTLEGLR